MKGRKKKVELPAPKTDIAKIRKAIIKKSIPVVERLQLEEKDDEGRLHRIPINRSIHYMTPANVQAVNTAIRNALSICIQNSSAFTEKLKELENTCKQAQTHYAEIQAKGESFDREMARAREHEDYASLEKNTKCLLEWTNSVMDRDAADTSTFNGTRSTASLTMNKYASMKDHLIVSVGVKTAIVDSMTKTGSIVISSDSSASIPSDQIDLIAGEPFVKMVFVGVKAPVKIARFPQVQVSFMSRMLARIGKDGTSAMKSLTEEDRQNMRTWSLAAMDAIVKLIDDYTALEASIQQTVADIAAFLDLFRREMKPMTYIHRITTI